MLNFSGYRLITFDCYGTLIDWESGILGAIVPILSCHRKAIGGPDILKIYADLEAEAEGGEYRCYRDVLRDVVRNFGERLGFSPTTAEQDSLPESLANWTPFPDTIAALRKLKSKFRLGIISNVDDDLFAATARRLQVPFDHVVTAGQAKTYKPSRKIFELAQSRMGVETHEWLHAAQSLYHDVLPAKALGIATVWVNRPSLLPGTGATKPASAEPDIEVASLEELARVATNF